MKKLVLVVFLSMMASVLVFAGVVWAVSQWSTNVPATVEIILAPTPTPSPTPAPNPGLSVTPPSLNFGQVAQGQNSGPWTLTLTNTGNVPFSTFGLSLNGAPVGLSVQGSNLPATLYPGFSQDIGVTLNVDPTASPAYYPFNVVVSAYY